MGIDQLRCRTAVPIPMRKDARAWLIAWMWLCFPPVCGWTQVQTAVGVFDRLSV